ncbi:HAD-IIIA family hydrolase [bacterium]|nr:HAD-IIIA family hydrolase [bacterium]
MIIASVKDIKQLKEMIKWFIVGTVAISIFGLVQYLLGINRVAGEIEVPFKILSYLPKKVLYFLSLYDQRITGSRDHPISFAEGLMMGGILMSSLFLFANFNKKRKIYLGLGLLIVGLNLIFTYSRGAWLGMVAGLFFIEIMGVRSFFPPSSVIRKSLLPLTLIVLILIVFLSSAITLFIGGAKYSTLGRVKNFFDSERIYMWESGWEIFKDYPVLGVGLKNVSLVYPEYKKPAAICKEQGHLHNNFIQIGVERGILGLIAFIILLGACLKKGLGIYLKMPNIKKYEKAVVLGCLGGVISFIVSGLTEYNYGDWEILALFWFMMGIMVVLGKQEQLSDRVSSKQKNNKKFAVFLDRDGTINREGGYINHQDRFTLLPHTAKAIKLLNKEGIITIVSTNQAGVARGYFKEEMVKVVHQKMQKLLAQEGAYLDAVYYCPHHPDVGKGSYRQDCNCRKPGTGMLEKGRKEFNIDLRQSFIVGDKISDVKWGHKVGAKSVMVLTGYGKGEYQFQRQDWDEQPDYIADDLYEAVKWILKQINKRENQ